MQPADIELITALKQGDKKACAELVKRFSPHIYNVALRLVREPTEAEEVLQETFINACRKVEGFEGRSSLATWLYRIAANNSLMRLRQQHLPIISLDEPQESEEDLPAPQEIADWDWNPDQLILTEEAHQVLTEAVENLPETLRAAFVLRDLEGLSTQEAAEVLGISPAALKVRLHRARLLLRERLSPYFSEYHSPALEEREETS
jgi:RNA polymerase sigma-70 factor (ECF subfamily)